MGDYKHDIEKYLRGELTPSEMHLLEKKALDDPFLADALEGASMITPDELGDDLALLKKKIQRRIEPEKKTVSLWYWPMRIAAGLLLLCVSGYLIFRLSDRGDTNQQLALNKPKTSTPAEPSIESDKSADTIQPSLRDETETVIVEAEKIRGDVSSQPAQPPSVYKPKKEETEVAVADIVAEPEPVIEPAPVESKEQDKGFISPESKRDDERRLAYSTAPVDRRKAKEWSAQEALQGKVAGIMVMPRRVLHGKVTDTEDGTGMPGVNVLIKGTDKGTVTDAEGNYELYFSDNVKDTTKTELLFSFIGMQNREVPIPSSDSVNVQLSPDYASLSEVVVIGYASSEDGIVREGENIYEVATPAGGRKAFKNYLVTSMQYPKIAIENNIEGKVTIQFTVDTSGVLSDFRIVKGIGFGCDQEVIRLIKEGPKWSATKRNDAPLTSKVKVRLKFKRPQ